MAYVPLWCKSNYSFLEGASHPAELVDRAHELALPALALTDRNGVYGVVKAHEEAQKRGQRLLLGSEVSVGTESIVLLASNREGYANLCALVSEGHREGKNAFRLTWDQVCRQATDLIALYRPGSGLDSLSEAFGDRLYAVADRCRWLDVPRERAALERARRYGLPIVAATEVLYHEGRQELQDVLTCIRHGVRLPDAGTLLKPNAEHGLKSTAEFEDLYADRPEWVARTLEVAERCQFSLSELEYRYPEEIPEGFDSPSWLEKLTFDGAARRYPGGVPAKVRAQIDKELALIKELKYSGYFVTMHDIVQFCVRNGILCQGRGSAANSAVCFCLGVTAVDPTRVNLLFERFLSRERAEPPDIDLDIEHDRREEVIQHMYRLYGRGRAAMVANVIRYRHRSALREVGKVLDVPRVDLDQVAKLLAHHDGGLPGAMHDAGLDDSPTHRRLLTLAEQLYQFPRHLSIHPGGFLLGSEPLSRIVPVEPATMADRTVIQWDKTDVETMGLFKVDLLGLGALTQLDYAFRLLDKHRPGAPLSMAAIPAEDRATYDLVCKADTVGVFQIESRAQMSMLPRLKPKEFYDLVIQISIVRPGPISGGMVHPYLRRRQGKEEITYPHKLLEPVLEKTKGIPLFQEQVMQIAMIAADYTPGEADQLRRDMAAWKQKGELERHHDPIISRMTAKGIAPEYAERIFSQIKGFGEYGFPESHAASFALIAYATSWLKAHHPDVFACALLNAWPMGFYSPATIMGDAKRHNVTLLPADLLHSDWNCTLEPQPGFRFLALRIGLRYIQGLSRSDADAILALRGKNLPLAAWKLRAGSVLAWEKLAVSGALEGLGVHRRQALWQVLDPADADPLGFAAEPERAFSPLSQRETIAWDYQSQDHSARAHLVADYRSELRRQGFLSAAQIAAVDQARVVRHAGLVTCRQRPGTANGVLFLTLEDESGAVNVVVWNRVWEKYRRTILLSSVLAVRGKLQMEDGVTHLVADHLWSPEVLQEVSEYVPGAHNFG